MTEIRSKSVIFKNEQDMSRSSILSGTGKNSLMMNSSVHEDPYFPHRYVDKAVGESNKWSGSRVWQEEPTKIVNLPSVKESYFKTIYLSGTMTPSVRIDKSTVPEI